MSISISTLRRAGLLAVGELHSATITFEKGGTVSGRVSLTVDARPAAPSVHLSYVEVGHQGEQVPVAYRVSMAVVKSNLGKGYRFYFICPETGRRCTSLYKPWSGRFLHRSAFTGLFYNTQVLAKSTRMVLFVYYEQQVKELLNNGQRLNSHYRGKPTRLQRRLERLCEKTERSFLSWENRRKG